MIKALSISKAEGGGEMGGNRRLSLCDKLKGTVIHSGMRITGVGWYGGLVGDGELL